MNGKPPEPEGWAEAAGVLGFALNVNTPDGLLFVKLKLVVLLLPPNWKTEPVTEQNNFSKVKMIVFLVTTLAFTYKNMGRIKLSYNHLI